eukprot:m.129310 g.129310  ORF g.129310 m.129310 type:complete len:84 (-) comp23633_c0_seq5:110-361(-)
MLPPFRKNARFYVCFVLFYFYYHFYFSFAQTWDFSDRYSWLGQTEKNPVSRLSGYMWAPLPWDVTYNPKPAVGAMITVLQGKD